MVVQINGKVRDHVTVSAEATENEIKEVVLAREKVANHLEGKDLKKFIVIPKKLVNIVCE